MDLDLNSKQLLYSNLQQRSNNLGGGCAHRNVHVYAQARSQSWMLINPQEPSLLCETGSLTGTWAHGLCQPCSRPASLIAPIHLSLLPQCLDYKNTPCYVPNQYIWVQSIMQQLQLFFQSKPNNGNSYFFLLFACQFYYSFRMML